MHQLALRFCVTKHLYANFKSQRASDAILKTFVMKTKSHNNGDKDVKYRLKLFKILTLKSSKSLLVFGESYNDAGDYSSFPNE